MVDKQIEECASTNMSKKCRLCGCEDLTKEEPVYDDKNFIYIMVKCNKCKTRLTEAFRLDNFVNKNG
jgi:hypothetical protein